MFLCTDHKRTLSQQSHSDLNYLCDDWLNQAIHHYEQQRWNFALPYAGCAMELCWMQLEHKTDAQTIVKSLCLAVYCNNMLQHMCEHEQGKAVLSNNWQQLHAKLQGNAEYEALLKSCHTLSEISAGHRQLIKQYTDWPYLTTVNHNRVLH